MTENELKSLALRISAEALKVPPEQRLDVISKQLVYVGNEDDRHSLETLLLGYGEAYAAAKIPRRELSPLLSFLLLVGLLVGLLIMAIRLPNPSEFQLRIFRLVAAICAAGAAAQFPGAFQLEGELIKGWKFKATAGFAVFLLVYWIFR